MVGEFIARVFCIRDAAQKEHWKTNSYAQHVALGVFYASVVEKLDGFVEAYQGNFGLVKDIPKVSYEEKDFVKYLASEIKWIGEHREHIAGEVEALENIVDDITALFLTTSYKLVNLK